MAEILDSLNINNDIQSVSQADEALIADTQASVVGLFGLTALVTKLNTLLEGVINANKNKLNGKYYTEYTEAELKNILEQVLKTLNDIDFTLKNATKPTLIYGYNSGSTTANQLLATQLDVLTNALPGDSKAFKVLVKDMFNDYSKAITSSKKLINKFFKLSGQNLLKDTGLTSSVLKGFLEKNSLWGAKKQLMKDLLAQLGDKKYIPITCKRKDGSTFVRNYQVDKYAQLVARTRFGQAQVLGAIETSEANDIYTFTVTSHNTQTAICKPHEGKIYTTDRELIDLGIFPALDGSTTPLYHVNCQHRLVPRVYSQAAMARLKARAA